MILDALRRADSERERGSVPGLRAQPVSPSSVDATLRSRGEPWHWVITGVAVGLLIPLVWYFAGRESPRRVIESPSIDMSTAPVSSVAPASPAATVVAAAQSPSQDQSRPVAEAAPWPQQDVRNAVAGTMPAAPASVRPDAKAESSASAAPAEAPIFSREQLPENIRAALPPLTIDGSMYSDNAAHRSVIVNGGLYRENDQLTADLTIEQIKRKAAVFKYKAYRFEVQF